MESPLQNVDSLDYFQDFVRLVEHSNPINTYHRPQSIVERYPEDLKCGICLDLLHQPHWLSPCMHIFCEPCLRRLSQARIVTCPVCRASIRQCFYNQELSNSIQATFNERFQTRQEMERQTGIHNLPLPPITRTLFEVITEWTEVYLTQEVFLVLLFFATVFMQIIIVISMNMLMNGMFPFNGIISLISSSFCWFFVQTEYQSMNDLLIGLQHFIRDFM